MRVFISSTFRDMHAERDHLVRIVFPELRERLRGYSVYLEEVDLRWGITKEQSENAETLALCLKTIDQCRPFFLGLLGERYGAVLKETEREVLRNHGLEDLAGRSVTEIEIAYGALRRQHGRRALFLLREPGALDGTSESSRNGIYVEGSAEGRSRLAELKRCLTESGVPLIRYSARWDASVPDRVNGVQGRLVDLDVFGNLVRDALWQAFTEELGLGSNRTEPQSPADPLSSEREAHARLIASRARVFVGRKAQSAALAEYVGSEQDRPCIVIGAPGSGKSALLARLVLDLAADRPDLTVLAHFTGASSEAASLIGMLTRLCHEIYSAVLGHVHRASIEAAEAGHAGQLAEIEAAVSGAEGTPDAEHRRRLANAHQYWREAIDAAFAIPTALAELKTRFGEFIAVVPADRRLVLVIDGLDQLDAADRAQRLDWLPIKLPAGVKIVASCVDDPCRGRSMLAAIRHRPHAIVEATPLSRDERLAIVREIPSLSAKTLDQRQTELLLSNPAACNPLFLTVALEELRGFGSFEGLMGRIRSLPGGHINFGARLLGALRLARPPLNNDLIQALFDQILARLEEEHDRETVKTVVTSLAISRRGLAESELAGLVAGLTRGNDLFAILRQLRPYLIDRQGLLGLYHRELELAVRSRYLTDTHPERHALVPTHSKEDEARRRLIRYFEARPWQPPSGDGDRPVAGPELARKCEELAWQLAELGSAYRLLCDPVFLEATAVSGRIAVLADDINHALRRGRERERESRRRWRRAGFEGRSAEITEPDDIVTRRVRYLEEAIRRHQAFLVRHPDALLQCLWSTLWWRDCPELPLHCEPGTARDLGRPPDLGLSRWLEQWCAMRAQRTGEELWLRALRPPARPVGTSDRSFHHGAELAVLATVPLRRWVVSGGDNIVRIWHADTGEALHSLVIGDALSLRQGLPQPDLRKTLAASTDEGTQEVAPDSTDAWLADAGTIRALASAPRGVHIAVGFGRKARLYDLASGEGLHTFELVGEVTSLAFSADGRLLAASDGTPTVRVWECQSGRQAHAIECDGAVQSVAFLGAHLLAASRQMSSEAPSTVLWDLATGKPTTTIPRPEIALSLDGRRLMLAYCGGEVEGGASNVNVYEARDGSYTRQVSHPTALQVGRGPLALSVNGDQIAFADAFDDGGQLHLVSVETGGDWPRRLGKPIQALVFPDVRDEETWHTMLIEKESDFVDDSVRQSMDGTRPSWIGEPLVVCGSADGTIDVVATTRGGPPPRWARRHKHDIVDIQFSPDGRYLASASSDTVRIWHALDGIEHLCLEPGARAITFSPDGQLIATASHDDQIRIWSVADGALTRSLACSAPTCLAYSADGATLLTGDDLGEVRLWPAQSAGTPRTLARTGSMAHALACSPDGAVVAVSCEDRHIRLIDGLAGQEIGSFPVTPPQSACALALQAHRLAFTPEGDQIVSVDSQVGETHFWQRDGAYLGIMNGSGDPVACGDGRYPWQALFHPLTSELSIRSARSREHVAFWPAERVTRITTHTSGVIFAAAEGRSVLLLCIENATSGRNPLSERP